MRVQLTRVHIPAASTIGYGWGTAADGRVVKFAGDHRPMREIGEALQESWIDFGEGIFVEVEPWQILSVSSAEKGN